MRDLLICIVLLVAVVSGTSTPLLLLAYFLIISLSFKSFLINKFTFRVNHVSAVDASFFSIALLVTIFMLPIENLFKLATTFLSLALSANIINGVSSRSSGNQVRIYSLVLGFILLGDLIHLSGVLGIDMNYYKSLVRFDELSDLERESVIGVLGQRYHGWFAEPSYHGTFTGLLCALIWNNGVRLKVYLIAIVFFVLCPTPMMILAFGAGVLAGMLRWRSIIVSHPFAFASVFFLSVLLVILLFASRFASFFSGVSEVFAGESVNTSEAIRLIYPMAALLSHFTSYGVFPQSVSCIELATCLPETLKFPLITYIIFFGLSGLLSISICVCWLYRSVALPVYISLLIASILSGGAGYVLQFGIIVAFLMNMPNSLQPKSFRVRLTGNMV